jgi:hypothetical protein
VRAFLRVGRRYDRTTCEFRSHETRTWERQAPAWQSENGGYAYNQQSTTGVRFFPRILPLALLTNLAELELGVPGLKLMQTSTPTYPIFGFAPTSTLYFATRAAAPSS